MRKNKAISVLAILIAIIMVAGLAGCNGGTTSDPTTPPPVTTPTPDAGNGGGEEVEAGVLTLGLIQPLTGPIAFGGQAAANGAIMAAEEINAAGGITIGGRQYTIELIIEDDTGTPRDAAAAASKLIFQDEVPLIMGTFTSSATLAAAEIANEEGVPIISPLSSAIGLTTSGFEYFFRGRVTTHGNVAYGAEAFAQLGFTTVGQLAINDDWGRGDLVEWPPLWEPYGVEVVIQETFDQGQTDFYPVLSRILMAQPEAIFVTASTEPASMIFTQLRELDPDITILTSGGIDPTQTLALAGPDVLEGIWFWSVDLPDTPESLDFDARYRARFNIEPMSNAKSGYDVMQIVRIAFENAGTTTDHRAIRDALRQVEFHGIMGHYFFDDTGESFLRIAYGRFDSTVERGFHIFTFEDMIAGNFS